MQQMVQHNRGESFEQLGCEESNTVAYVNKKNGQVTARDGELVQYVYFLISSYQGW